ncbi:hypothetical protein [Pseudomonas nitroreducens]|uniref:Uncharacterized protein n=2 Tax=Pseudomonas nitroreducens TaxID=46680 RepID=A0A6G6J1V5_PSENT|nr:hypothetical protein [Pseudomonas nitroreducens]QIE89207.1 hypothetical protein G5B91_24260 [Pseudomonas nitroreducens]
MLLSQPKPLPMPQPTLSFWKLTLAIAVGTWLGCLAVAATAWLVWRNIPLALAPHLAPPSTATSTAPPPTRSNEEMFQQYLQRQQALQEQQNRQVEKSEQEKRFNSAPCQFWLQQYQADPTQKNREKMDGYCG